MSLFRKGKGSLPEKCDLAVKRIHTHIGSGSDPKVWLKVALMNFQLVEQFPSILRLIWAEVIKWDGCPMKSHRPSSNRAAGAGNL